MHWHECLALEFGITNFTTIDDMADITSIVWTIHTKLRQDANQAGSLVTKITDDFEFDVDTTKRKWSVLKPKMIQLAALYGFTYGSTVLEKNKIGTLNSILSLIVCFRPRSNEVRSGTNRIILRKSGSDTMEVDIGNFGLAPRHAVLMAGSSYNPTLQSSMKQSLGPTWKPTILW